MNYSPLEQLARQYGNVVQYDAPRKSEYFLQIPEDEKL